MTAAWMIEARSHAQREAPREACGLLVLTDPRSGALVYRPCRNMAIDPERDFEIGPWDQAHAESVGYVVAVVHSHPGASCRPSQADLAAHARGSVAWWVLGDDGAHCIPSPHAAQLEGRRFIYGVSDCWSAVEEWHWQSHGVMFPHRMALAEGIDHAWGWWERGVDLYRMQLPKAGFSEIPMEQARPGDVVLMSIGSRMPNHIGVRLEGGKLLHHALDRLSVVETYSDFYRERTRHAYRHAALA